MEANLALPWIILTIISIVTRVGPLFATKWLKDKPWVDRIGAELPSMILILLIFHEAQGKIASEHGSLLAVGAGITATVLMHRWKRQTILSIAAGVAAYFILC